MRPSSRGTPGRTTARHIAPCAAALAVIAWSAGVRGEELRGVMLITIDCGRMDHFSCYGYARATTPTIDGLASRGTRFSDSTTSGVGTPSAIAALFTARNPLFAEDAAGRARALWGMERFLREDDLSYGVPRSILSLPEYMKTAGFATAGFAPNPYLFSEFGFGRGFDLYDNFRDVEWKSYPNARVVADRAGAWLDQNGQERFFLYVHFMDAHAPWNVSFSEGKGFFNVDGSANPGEVSSGYMGDAEASMKRALLPHAIDLYDDGLRAIDTQVGRLLDLLNARGLAETTVVIVTADHGEELMEHGDTFHRGTVFEELLRVPLVIKAPGSPLPDFCAPARTIDIYPTIAELVGMPAPSGLEGESLFSSIRPQAVFVESRTHRSVRAGQYKLILDRATGWRRLYDLSKDPLESTDISETHAALIDDLLARMHAHRRLLSSQPERTPVTR